MNTERRLQAVAVLLGVVLILGTAGFMMIEHWDLLDSFFMTVITITTVGYEEVHPLSRAGRAFASGLIILGVGATFYAMSLFFELLIEGQIRGLVGKRKLRRSISRMKDHYVVCGYGRVGTQVVLELRRRGRKVVVIENQSTRQDELTEEKIPFVPGDATDDKTLCDAGIKAARGLVVTVPNEANNVLIVLSGRQLNPALKIVGRADEEQARKKLELAGADTVVCPHELGGRRMALATVSPHVLDFMKIAGDHGSSGIRIEEIRVALGSRLCGMTLRESPIKSQLGLTVIGLRKAGGSMRVNPGADEVVEENDILIVIGAEDTLATLRELTGVED